MSSQPGVFVDTSVLIDYCRPYAEDHDCTQLVLDNASVPLVMSDFIKDKFSTLMKQRQDLYTKFFEEVPRYFDDIKNPTEAEMQVAREKIFDIGYIEQIVSSDIHASAENDLQILKSKFGDMTPHEFLRKIDDIQQRAQTEESAINQVSETVPCRIHSTLEPYLHSTLSDEMRATAVAHAVSHLQGKSSNRLLVRHGDPAFRFKEEINNQIQTWVSSRATLEIISPRQAAEAFDAN